MVVKGLLSKHTFGYRGGNVVERPEKLSDEIKEGKILPFERFKQAFDDFVINILNKRPSKGKNHMGQAKHLSCKIWSVGLESEIWRLY